MPEPSTLLTLGLAAIAVFGTVAGAFVGLLSGSVIERRRQSFELEREARRDRAQAMQAARILDSALMEAEAIGTHYVLERKRLWPENLVVPDKSGWLEWRGVIASVVDPSAWITLNIGFISLGHMSEFEVEYRKLGYDHETDLSSGARAGFEPVVRDISAARRALHPVAYPDHIRLPEGHPMLTLLAEQRESGGAEHGG